MLLGLGGCPCIVFSVEKPLPITCFFLSYIYCEFETELKIGEY